ncbi:putative bifunctional diguanylate cyclase/phosphodiesterase [Martelella radicis]|uniref:Diguanylate cyclase (GGDEF)-like protein n=1 Tax=Martelella radicis TaxID=1397476 RepID=A0A7W6KKK9_9HYPH|nr:GGDEF domain-containing phosphodiesterase [Martelella radicis]MBB4121628.1 diguanylate cyclase (GGDEF)-like protein [Martelella radicis]
MALLKTASIPRDRRSTLRLYAILTVLFFATLATGTVVGGVFIRDAIRQERIEQAEARAAGFAKALKSVLNMTDNVGKALAESFDDGGLEGYDTSVETFLASAPWTKAVVLNRGDVSLVLPQDLSAAMRSLPLPEDGADARKIFGPFTLPNGERILVYRYTFDAGNLELVVGFEAILEAVGLLELEGTTRLSVQTVPEPGPDQLATAGESDLTPEDAIHEDIRVENATWTISVSPHHLTEGNFDWARAFRLAIGLLALAFVAPFIALLLLFRARLRDNINIRRSMMAVDNLSRHLDVALNASNIGLWEHDLETGVQIWDDQILRIYGLEGQSHVQSFQSWRSRLHPEDQERFRQFNWEDAENDNGFLTEYRIITPVGQEKTIRSAGNAYRDADGKRKFVGVNWDVSADKALQEALAEAKARAEEQNVALEDARARMEEIALQDTLTGIPNRRHFEKRLDAAQAGGALPEGMNIVLIDLDGFKTINDTMGHFFGDDVLRYAADTFTQHVGPQDFLARTGGDEFVALMPAESDVEAFAAAVTAAFAKPLRIDGRSCRLGVSLGIATAEDSSDTASDLLIKADLALYEAKNRGRGRTVNYTSNLMAKTFSLKRLADELQEAVENGEITAHYQPIFDVRTSTIVGVEALARWQHPRRGVLEPKAFLDVAEQLGLLHSIDDIVFQKALSILETSREAGMPLPGVSVNISSQRLRDPLLLDRLSSFNLPPDTVHFELLESIPFDRPDSALIKTVSAIRKLGIGIDLDDFGSGYASLVGLTQVRPDRLKIAGQLIAPITGSEESLQIVETIVRIAKTFNIGVICEGVTSTDHFEKLEALGCYLQQGYYFSRPMDEKQFIAFLRARKGND